MYCALKVTTDYSILKSLIKIKDLIKTLKELNLNSCAICDNNLFGSLEFYYSMKENNLNPIIGLEVTIENNKVYLYAKNYLGYQKLLKINTAMQIKNLNIEDIKDNNIKIILPYESQELFSFLPNAYLGYKNISEKEQLANLNSKLVYVNDAKCLKQSQNKYLPYLSLINNGETIKNMEKFELLESNFIDPSKLTTEDILSTEEFIKDINIEIKKNDNCIPKYYKCDDSEKYLINLAKKGLQKRLNDNISEEYNNRLNYELETIQKMGFVDYFLIVYDYVLFAKKNHILVGPGRGSAAGSLVSYCLGITNVDPLKYDLLFERFLNPDRITMPDIDIDFDFSKREQVIDYVKQTYGKNKVAPIITFGTLASKQVIRDLGKVLEYDSSLVDKFVHLIDAKLSLKENYEKDSVQKFIKNYPNFKNLCQICLNFEGLKRHTSTHAAGIVISSKDLDDLIPVQIDNNGITCGITMEYLENIGLLKMDFLALRNLTIIDNVLNLIPDSIDLNNISLNDAKVYDLFKCGKTDGIFQFESSGMKNLILKFKPNCFADLVTCLAIFRPGPMENIDTFIKRKNGQEKITYLNDDLKDILESTYGIIVYQEQIMQILVKMAGFSYAQADVIRRAMSKKKKDIIIKYEEEFINNCLKNGYSRENAKKVYDLILKFANYGFNKAHSVAYSIIAYQMAYLKVYYPEYFIANLLNMSIGSDVKTKQYLDEAKIINLKIQKANVNKSLKNYFINENKEIILPFESIKSLGETISTKIINERNQNGIYKDYLDFVSRTYRFGVNKLILENLIYSGALDCFSLTKKTMIENIALAINYATLIENLNKDLVMEPEMVLYPEFDEDTIRSKEYEMYGFYLTNHPASKYQDKIVSSEINKYFDKIITVIGLIDNIHVIKTKKNEEMAFISLSDEYGKIEVTIFPKQMDLLVSLKKGDLIKCLGKVNKRFADFSVIANKIEKL